MVEQQRSPNGNTAEVTNGDEGNTAPPGRMPIRILVSWALIGLSIAVGLSAAGLWLVQRQGPSAARVEVIIPTPAPIVVHVLGAVRTEGVYSLPPGSRIADAIDAAGGATSGADLSRLNLAARAPDGARLHVPHVNDIVPDASITGTTEDRPETTSDSAPAPGDFVDLNTAGLSGLMSLPGIGEKRAAAIIQFRELNGLIESVDDLLEIDGIGQATVDKIRPSVVQQ